MSDHSKGAAGEEHAARYLEALGYTILKRNFRIRTGEVDIIAVRDDCLTFVEVKTWDRFGRSELERSINDRKRRRIRKAAEVFLLKQPEYRGHHMRFDVVLVSDNVSSVDYIEGAFDGAEH